MLFREGGGGNERSEVRRRFGLTLELSSVWQLDEDHAVASMLEYLARRTAFLSPLIDNCFFSTPATIIRRLDYPALTYFTKHGGPLRALTARA